MMKWIKKDSALSIEEVVERNTGINISEFLNPPEDLYIKGLDAAADRIRKAIADGESITIYGDYDADGITSSTIIFVTIKKLNYDNVRVILPKRFSEGYGLSMAAVDRVESGLLITIDNGITAVEEIAHAKNKGLGVVVLDHHLRREDGLIPEADVVVDPSAIEGSDFNHYCGAGIAFKLAKIMLNDEILLDRLSGLAAIGTVADVMPLVHENRNIVIRGIRSINNGVMVPGLAALLQKLDLYEVNEGDFGFKLGPIINAAGRLLDDGAKRVFNLLISGGAKAERLAEELIALNDERKRLVEENMAYCEQIIEDECMYGENPLLIYTTATSEQKFGEGVVGVLAGRLAEKYKVPAIVLTEGEDGILKGSGRSDGTIHLKQLLDTAEDLLARYGGHAGAAGLSVTIDNVEALRARLSEGVKAFPQAEVVDDAIYYDLEVNASQLPAVMEKLKRFAPFGEGNPRPVFKVNGVMLLPRGGRFYNLMGKDGQHLKLFARGFDAVGFDMADKYKEANEPMQLELLGFLGENRFMNNVTLQVELKDFSAVTSKKENSNLAQLVSEKMKKKGYS